MAVRPIFIPRVGRGPLVEEVPINIRWHGGFAVSQKQKNIASLHEAAADLGIHPILEISTKSLQEVGRRLSAFNLKIDVKNELLPLESVYQGSKVFKYSGQHTELMYENPYKAKKDVRHIGKGDIVSFRFNDIDYPTEPKNAFYDWLYIKAISPHEKWLQENVKYRAFSDIEFNPSKSINCQGRAVAEFFALSSRNSTMECVEDFDLFRSILIFANRDS